MSTKKKEEAKKELTEEEKAAALDKQQRENSSIINMPNPKQTPGVNETFKEMFDSFGQMAYTQKTGQIYPNGDEEEEEDDETDEKKKKKKKAKRGDKYSQFANAVQNQADSIDIQNLYSEDPNKIDIINNLTSIKLL